MAKGIEQGALRVTGEERASQVVKGIFENDEVLELVAQLEPAKKTSPGLFIGVMKQFPGAPSEVRKSGKLC